jgi:preprotein translocase subunit SecY
MRDETKTLRRVVVWTFVFLVLYLIFILIQESGYIFDQGSDDYIKRDF